MFVDFAALKEQVSFEDAIQLLSLDVKQAGNQWRGPCPCGGGERSLVITQGKGFFCFNDKKGGDVIALTAHVLKLGAKDAAQELAERAGIVQVPTTSTRTRSTVPQEQEGSQTQKLAPLAYLEAEHPAVDAVGFDTEFCRKHGIGYAGKGTARGYVLIPFRDEDGTLLGYVGITEAWLPKDFQPSNVIQLKRA